ncbi:MAG TPA: electron transfer flavoprotein subunit beta/FixA family protein [Solirubrobacteraceae bacterium]|nr:electron transfer flavoprotein subunit beta/FixA family protein [Solirubrobacteraceae bacterium]
MKIVVPVKQVAALDDEFELLDDGSGVDPDFLEFDLNEWDAFSLEVALQLREASDDGSEVVAVTVGDEESEEALLSCLAKGADRAVRVSDDDLATDDPLTVARVLAAAVERESADLVLCGVQSSDAVNGATGVALAGYLDLPHVAVVKALEHENGSVVVDRELEGGLVERLRIGLPALLTIQTGINQPRYANLRAIKQAREKPLDVVEAGELGLDQDALAAAAGSRRRGLSPPDRGEGAEMMSGGVDEMAARIAEIVRERMSG